MAVSRYDHQLIYLLKVDGSDATLEPISTPSQRFVAVVTIRTDLDAFANDDYIRLIVDGAYVDILPLADLADMVSVVGVSVTFRVVLSSQPRELKTKSFGDSSADVRLWRLDGVPEISVRGSDIRQHIAGKVATIPLSLFYRSDEGKSGTLFWCRVGAREERKDASLPLSSITCILVGKQHAAFINKRLAPDERCFSIITEHTQLHIECASVRERKDWLSALKNDLASSGVMSSEAPSLVVRHTPGVNHARPAAAPGHTATRVLSTSEVEAEQKREAKWHSIVDGVRDTPAIWRQQAAAGGKSTNVTLGFNKETCAIYWLVKGTTIQTQDKSGSLLSLTEIYKGKQVGAHVSADASGRITKEPTPGTDDQSFSLVFSEPAPGTSSVHHNDGTARRMVTRTIDLIAADGATRDAFIAAIQQVLVIKGRDVVEQAKYVYRTADAAAAAQAANDAAEAQAEVEAIAASVPSSPVTNGHTSGSDSKETKSSLVAIPGLVLASLPSQPTCVTLNLSATNLVQMDVMTPSDPLVAIVVKDAAGNFTQQVSITEWILDSCNPSWSQSPSLPYDVRNTLVDVRISVYDADDDGIVESADRLIGSYDTSFNALVAAASSNTPITAELVNSNAKIQRLLTARKSCITIRPSLTTGGAANGASSAAPTGASSSSSRVAKYSEPSLDTTFIVFYRDGEFESSTAYQSSMSFFCEDHTLFWSSVGTRTKSYRVTSSNGIGSDGILQSCSVPLTSITGILVGKQKSVFDNACIPGAVASTDGKGVRRAVEEHSFTLLTTTRQLDLEAKSSEQRTLWLSSLQSSLAKLGRDVQFVSRLHITEELDGVGQELEFEGWPLHEQDNIGERLAITIGCRDLPRADEASDSDPVVAAFERDPATGRQRLIGYTEWVKDQPSPNFTRQLVLYNPTSKDPLRAASQKEIVFRVYDVDRAIVSEHDLLGSAIFSVAELLASPGERLSHPLHHLDHDLDTKMEDLNSRIVVTPSFTDAPLIHDPAKALRASVIVYAPVLNEPTPLDVWYVDDGTNRGGSLYWGSSKDSRNASAQHLRDVIQVSIGRQTPVFNKLVDDGNDRSLSIRVKSNPHGSLLDLEFTDTRARNVFLEALEQVILRSTPDDVHVVHENRITFGGATASVATIDIVSPSSGNSNGITGTYGTGIKPGRLLLQSMDMKRNGHDSVPPSPNASLTPNGAHAFVNGAMRFGPVTPTSTSSISSGVTVAPRSLVGGHHHRTHSVPVKFNAPLTPNSINGATVSSSSSISPASSPFRFGVRATSPSEAKSSFAANNDNNHESVRFDESRDELFAEAAKYHASTGSDFILVVRQPGTDRIITLCSDKFHDHKDRLTEAVAAASAVLRA